MAPSDPGLVELLERASNLKLPGGYQTANAIPAHGKGRALRNRLYQLANQLDPTEKDNLAGRIKHNATNITAALATGFGEAMFRNNLARVLESRGSLYAVQDHLQQLVDLGMLEEQEFKTLQEETNGTLVALNDYMGVLVRENQQSGQQGQSPRG